MRNSAGGGGGRAPRRLARLRPGDKLSCTSVEIRAPLVRVCISPRGNLPLLGPRWARVCCCACGLEPRPGLWGDLCRGVALGCWPGGGVSASLADRFNDGPPPPPLLFTFEDQKLSRTCTCTRARAKRRERARDKICLLCLARAILKVAVFVAVVAAKRLSLSLSLSLALCLASLSSRPRAGGKALVIAPLYKYKQRLGSANCKCHVAQEASGRGRRDAAHENNPLPCRRAARDSRANLLRGATCSMLRARPRGLSSGPQANARDKTPFN